MTIEDEILQYLHYHPLSNRVEITLGITNPPPSKASSSIGPYPMHEESRIANKRQSIRFIMDVNRDRRKRRANPVSAFAFQSVSGNTDVVDADISRRVQSVGGLSRHAYAGKPAEIPAAQFLWGIQRKRRPIPRQPLQPRR